MFSVDTVLKKAPKKGADAVIIYLQKVAFGKIEYRRLRYGNEYYCSFLITCNTVMNAFTC